MFSTTGFLVGKRCMHSMLRHHSVLPTMRNSVGTYQHMRSIHQSNVALMKIRRPLRKNYHLKKDFELKKQLAEQNTDGIQSAGVPLNSKGETKYSYTEPPKDVPMERGDQLVIMMCFGLFGFGFFVNMFSQNVPGAKLELTEEEDKEMDKLQFHKEIIGSELGFEQHEIDQILLVPTVNFQTGAIGAICLNGATIALSRFFFSSSAQNLFIKGAEVTEEDKKQFKATFQMSHLSKLFVMAHEMGHIFEIHNVLMMILRPFNLLMTYATFTAAGMRVGGWPVRVMASVLVSGSFTSLLSRYYEIKADRRAMLSDDIIQGGIDHLEQTRNRNLYVRSMWQQQKYAGKPNWMVDILTGIDQNGEYVFSYSHPTYSLRIKYLREEKARRGMMKSSKDKNNVDSSPEDNNKPVV